MKDCSIVFPERRRGRPFLVALAVDEYSRSWIRSAANVGVIEFDKELAGVQVRFFEELLAIQYGRRRNPRFQ